MSSGNMESTQTPQVDRSPLQRGVDWVAKHWPRLRLGHEGFMLDKIQRQQRCVEVSARNAMTGDNQDTNGWPTDPEQPQNMPVLSILRPQHAQIVQKHRPPPTWNVSRTQ